MACNREVVVLIFVVSSLEEIGGVPLRCLLIVLYLRAD